MSQYLKHGNVALRYMHDVHLTNGDLQRVIRLGVNAKNILSDKCFATVIVVDCPGLVYWLISHFGMTDVPDQFVPTAIASYFLSVQTYFGLLQDFQQGHNCSYIFIMFPFIIQEV